MKPSRAGWGRSWRSQLRSVRMWSALFVFLRWQQISVIERGRETLGRQRALIPMNMKATPLWGVGRNENSRRGSMSDTNEAASERSLFPLCRKSCELCCRSWDQYGEISCWVCTGGLILWCFWAFWMNVTTSDAVRTAWSRRVAVVCWSDHRSRVGLSLWCRV